MVALLKRQNDICCSASSVVVSSFYSPSLGEFSAAKIGALDLSNNRNRCLGILGAAGASSNNASKGLFIHEVFSFLNLEAVGLQFEPYR